MNKISKKLLLVGLLAMSAAVPVEAGQPIVSLSGITNFFAVYADKVLNACLGERYSNKFLHHYIYAPGQNTRDFKKLGLEPRSCGRIAKQFILAPFVGFEWMKEALNQAHIANKEALNLNLKKNQGANKPTVKE